MTIYLGGELVAICKRQSGQTYINQAWTLLIGDYLVLMCFRKSSCNYESVSVLDSCQEK